MLSLSLAPEVIFQAVSDATRLRLLRLLHREELNVQELVRITGMSQPRISKHLAVLRDAGWVRQRKEGTWSWYRTVACQEFPAGTDLYESVLSAADAVAAAGEDDLQLAGVLTERDARARDFFAGIAGRWDEIRRVYEHPDVQLGAVGALVDENLEVVDIGTGTGALLPLLAGSCSRVVAVDKSEAMLARARVLCERANLTGVTFQKADIQALPFADGSFDAAYCSMVLHHVARPARAVNEMARVVRPGGKVVVIAFTRHNLVWMREELAHHWLGFAREDIERLLRAADLQPRRYLTRRRTADVATDEQAVRTVSSTPEKVPRRKGEAWNWPEVFLSVSVKRRDPSDRPGR